MDFDQDDLEPSDHEPEEYDPEAEFRDPQSDSITIPRVETDETDVPPDLLRTFWIVVLVVNAAILALSLGAMLIAFRGDLRRGGALLAGGVVLCVLALRRYRTLETGSAAAGGEGGTTAPGDRDPQAETISGPTDEGESPEESNSHDEDRT